MYRKLLAIHLCTAMFSLAFLAMYGVSAVQMAHRTWFNLTPRTTRSQLQLSPGITDARAAVQSVPCRGELNAVRPAPGRLQFRIVRPGNVCDVDYAAATGQASLIVNEAGVMGMLNRLHHIAGMWHDFRLLNIWSAILGIISAGLLLLGFTGIYLWFRNHRERLVGIVLLAGGCGLATVLIVSMRF